MKFIAFSAAALAFFALNAEHVFADELITHTLSETHVANSQQVTQSIQRTLTVKQAKEQYGVSFDPNQKGTTENCKVSQATDGSHIKRECFTYVNTAYAVRTSGYHVSKQMSSQTSVANTKSTAEVKALK
jgi:hypothetical protein